jgi:uncharacterized membrane protein
MSELSMLDLVTTLSALGCALVAGVFFAFSTFVMKALGKLPPAQGVAAMQSINVVVINPWFLTVFFGAAVACVVVMIGSLARWHTAGSAFLLAGSVLYLVGTIVVTMRFNVPRNNKLAAVMPQGPEAATLWASYISSWTAWNHVRTIAAFAAAVLFSIALWIRA